jgi:hypothetical protein
MDLFWLVLGSVCTLGTFTLASYLLYRFSMKKFFYAFRETQRLSDPAVVRLQTLAVYEGLTLKK